MAAEDKKQAQMKQEIGMYLRKKDYYDILGISRTAQEPEIKKAYKKLALRFHPDKNNIESSKEVFKKVSNAYTNLIDPEKRAQYDRYGPEEDREPQYRPRRQYHNGRTQEDEFQDIFRAFFGGAPAYQHNNFQHFTFNMGGRQANQGQGSNIMYWLFLLAIIYIFPLIFSSKQTSLYSTSPSNTYRIPMKTSVFQVAYYVREDFFTQSKRAQYSKLIEREVDKEFYIQLAKACEMEKWTAKSQGGQASGKKKAKDSCMRLYQIQDQYQEYVRDLIYGY